MDSVKQPILRIPESVKEDTFAYRSRVEKFVQGQTSAVAFRAYRVPMGIYEQRAAGKYMVRIRIGAGLVLPYQLERIAQLSKIHGNGIVHVTTRQDIQIHQVNIEDTPDVLEGLLEVGLSPRGGGGNTVRNVTACPRAGVCPKEEFDVSPYAIAAAEYLLQFKSSYNLPRKYKIVFSGCSADCAFASVADLGFFAHQKDGIKGFAVYAGGGLGSNPAVGLKIEDIITDNEILEVAEAIKRLFDKYGDRSNKHKARLRYVVARVGTQEFIKLYKIERQEVRNQGLGGDIPKVRAGASKFEVPRSVADSDNSRSPLRHNVLAEKTEGLFTVRLRLNLGDIPADDLIKIGQIAEKFGQGLVRTSQLQNLLITSVPQQNIEKVRSALEGLSIDVTGNDRGEIVTCTGAATCKLGLCLSRGLADAISDKLNQSKDSRQQGETFIRISGCPNSCGHHYIADIGFQGKARRVNGRLMPCYDVLVGAQTTEHNAHLAERIATVPAKKIPDLLAEAFATSAIKKEQLKDLIERYGDFSSPEFPDDYYYDFGATEPFSLAGRGPGECGAGVMDVIKLDVDQAKEAIRAAHKIQAAKDKSESVYEAIIAAARALLVIFGLEPKKDREIFAAFSKHLIEPAWVKPQAQQLLDNAIDWRMGDRNSINDLLPQVEDLAKRVEELFLSLDANLEFRTKPAAQEANAGVPEDKAETEKHTVDLRGVACPLNFVKAKIELEKIDVGEILEVLLDDGEPIKNVPESFTQQGQEVIEAKNVGDHFFVKVRRKK
ncbi:MAG: sulfurtransferase TusA family protein [Planctomycetota bacterium]|jgi:sulfite reductase (ferredoxin)